MTNSAMMQIKVGATVEIQSSYYRKAIGFGQGKGSRLPERCVVCKLKLGRYICGLKRWIGGKNKRWRARERGERKSIQTSS